MILFASQITKVETRADRGYKLTLLTPELPPDTGYQLLKLHQSLVYTAIKPERMEPEELEVLEAAKTDFQDKGKTPSQRLRAVLFLVYNIYKPGESFNEFYARKMEEIINHYKSKLPE